MSFEEYPAMLFSKGTPMASKFPGGGNRIKFTVKFENGQTLELFAGGSSPRQQQEFAFMAQAQPGAHISVVQKFKQDGSPAYYLAESVYQHMPILQQAMQAPVAPGQGFPQQSSASPFPAAAPPAQFPPQPQAFPQQPAAQPPPPASPSLPMNLVEPLDTTDLLHASVKIGQWAQVWMVAHAYASNVLAGVGFVDPDGRKTVELATSFAIEATPWKLRQETLDVAFYRDPVHGELRQPLIPDELRRGLQKRAEAHTPVGDEEAVSALRTRVVIGLKSLFGESGRGRFTGYMFGIKSSKELSEGQLMAISSWMNLTRGSGYQPSPVVYVEAALVKEVI